MTYRIIRFDRDRIAEYSVVLVPIVVLLLMVIGMGLFFVFDNHTFSYSAPVEQTSYASVPECKQADPVKQQMQSISNQLNSIGQHLAIYGSGVSTINDLAAHYNPAYLSQIDSLEAQYTLLGSQLNAIQIKYSC